MPNENNYNNNNITNNNTNENNNKNGKLKKSKSEYVGNGKKSIKGIGKYFQKLGKSVDKSKSGDEMAKYSKKGGKSAGITSESENDINNNNNNNNNTTTIINNNFSINNNLNNSTKSNISLKKGSPVWRKRTGSLSEKNYTNNSSDGGKMNKRTRDRKTSTPICFSTSEGSDEEFREKENLEELVKQVWTNNIELPAQGIKIII